MRHTQHIEVLTLVQNHDREYPVEVLRGMHQPLLVPSAALQLSSRYHLSSNSIGLNDKNDYE
jgi:hypothetical protein